MVDEIRFFADQHIPEPISDGLIRRGIDVLTAQSSSRCGLSDADQLAFANADGRVLFTFDSDFLALHSASHAHTGIVWCPATKYGIGELVKLLVLLHVISNSTEMRGHLEYL